MDHRLEAVAAFLESSVARAGRGRPCTGGADWADRRRHGRGCLRNRIAGALPARFSAGVVVAEDNNG